MTVMNRFKHALAALLLLSLFASPVLADDRRHKRQHGSAWHSDWRDSSGSRHGHDNHRWPSGRWHHGHHEGRSGWWWIVGGVWYLSAAAAQTYPSYYQAPMTIAPPALPVPPPTPVPTSYWHYCANPAGYYPYVAQCAVAWQRVAAVPR